MLSVGRGLGNHVIFETWICGGWILMSFNTKFLFCQCSSDYSGFNRIGL